MVRIVEVDFRNKKHMECCDTLLSSLSELEDTQLALIDMQKEITDVKSKHSIESDVDERLGKKINDIDEKHRKMHERAEVAGCFKDNVAEYSKKKCNVVEDDG